MPEAPVGRQSGGWTPVVPSISSRTERIALSRQAAQLGWLQAYESELPGLYTTYISFEAEAHSMRYYESLFVPGLPQTESYAHAVIRSVLPLANDADVQARVEARMQRQEALSTADPLRLWAILDEAVCTG